jgi:uncharacterized membrane protein YkoI
MKTFLTALALIASTTGGAAELPCSVKATRLDADTKARARYSEADARKTALAQIQAPGAAIASGGLEVEHGCLIYTYDIKVPGRRGVEEVAIDAGNGKVLLVEHESPAKEASEKLFDTAPKKK